MACKRIIFSFIALLLPLCVKAEETEFCANGVYISEISAAGGDWIELYNGGEETVELTGWILSDKKHPEKSGAGHTLALSGTLAPHAYTVYKELPFGVSAAGEKIYLFNAEGERADRFETGTLRAGLTSGRLPERGGERFFFDLPTPGEANGAGYIGSAPAPLMEDRALYREEPFLLRIEGSGCELRYTLDGAEPTKESALYTAPVEIIGNTVVRVRAYREGYLPSETVTVTYLFEKPHTVPAVTLAMDPKQWEKLRVAKYKKFEAESSVAFYESDGSFGIGFPAGISIRGNASRKNEHKSFGIHLRAGYGQRAVTYPFWGEGTALPYANLTLRNGSQDIGKARMRDSFGVRASAGLKVDKIRSRFVVVYVNGTYYGLSDLNEGMNQDYVQTHYGIDGDTVNVVQWNTDVMHGSGDGVLALRRFVAEHDLSLEENYAVYRTMTDIDAFTDYLIAETFFCCTDYHNVIYMGTDDGSFLYRPMLYDLDTTLYENNSRYNNMGKYFMLRGFHYGGINQRFMDTGLFGALKQNAGWRQQFLERYAYLLCHDYSPETLEALFDQMVAEMEPEMPRNIETWHEPESMARWHRETAALREQIRLRHKDIQSILCSEFSVSKEDWAALMQKYGGTE